MQATLIFLVVVIFGLSECHKHKHLRLLSRLQAKDAPKLHAVLVAGSNGWYNYRHQADVAHAYHLLIDHGIPKESIVTMMYDDIAHSKANPYPGKLFNRPYGKDVYKNINIDYKGSAVTPKNFVAVLTGGVTTGGNGKVLKSGPNDHVFVYFTDHGAPGLISFPDGILTVKILDETLRKMHATKMFGKLVFYLEACESGSMFESTLASNLSIYAITAANGRESSWGTYCENTMKLPCLGDLFSIAWMEDSDIEDLTLETLARQFDLVKKRTDKSHVQHFGDLSIANEPVADFQGDRKTDLSLLLDEDEFEDVVHKSWPSRDIELNHLISVRQETLDHDERHRITSRIEDIRALRRDIKVMYHDIVADLIKDPEEHRAMFKEHRKLTQIECHHEVVHAFDDHCFDFNDYEYALHYVRVLVNLCEKFRSSEKIVATIQRRCDNADVVFDENDVIF